MSGSTALHPTYNYYSVTPDLQLLQLLLIFVGFHCVTPDLQLLQLLLISVGFHCVTPDLQLLQITLCPRFHQRQFPFLRPN
jgi:hypothetical protein